MASGSAHEDNFHGFEVEESLTDSPSDFGNWEVRAGTDAPINKTS